MPAVIKIPPALRKVFNDEAEAAFIDVLNQFDAAQSNGFQRTLETHFQAFKSYLDQRLAEADAKIEKRFSEVDRRFAESDAKMETRLAEYHKSTLRWMFTFFIGTVLTLVGFMITFLQIVAK